MLEIRNLSFDANAEEKIEILKDLSVRFETGKLYVITGPNGGGKSSLAKVIMGIVRPSEGRIILDGEDITGKSVSERARLGIGYSFQTPPRFKGLKVRDLLALSVGGEVTEDLMCSLLYRVGLCAHDYLDRDVDAGLSGGEMKRIEIATVLARQLKVAIFDEPEAGIDLWSFRQLSETFREIHAQDGLTMIIISHQERIMRLADEIIVLADGRIAEQAGAEEILAGIANEAACGCTADRCKEDLAHA